ncbi:MAG: CoB--CoM heterodisulfide reductase iron-sulfur subunit A family protein [Candidatus Bipolaricaulota bacterium]|nr:CoB--CoM heterodisulfide reductase iron-sulfur subunit A family protein [Candidatus Bipolaricaulota bacterium]MDW8151770.1 CoB--CoM heterodisulfide reductase iron-sulfur subunit A family protein [Candidatus Bipolaricaulota bacterium]
MPETRPRLGVFVCHCGKNIAGTVDVAKVAEIASRFPGVVYATHHEYMCSDPGQALLKRAIKEHRLTGVVVAACSPTMHEETFRRAAEEAGLNPYLLEIANIREQVSWVHSGPAATEKAVRVVRAIAEKVRGNRPLRPAEVGVTRRALVVGGGIAGIQAALDIANAGFEVILVERSPSIGGHMAQLSETFPTLDCSQCILTPKMVEVARHPRIRILAYSEVEEVSGFVGNYRVRIRKKPTYVDPAKCNLCGECAKVCPVRVPNEFDRGLSLRAAIYIPFPQAVPSTYTLDARNCLGLLPLCCGKCAEVCEAKAIDFDMHEEILEEEVGAIVLATGYELYPKEAMAEYGYGTVPDVIDGLEFERLLSASGPTRGEIRRPSDGKIPKEVVFIQCSGSRDPEHHKPYCSKICCMYTAKHALLYRHAVPDGQAYVFYIDIRAGGKDYEEFVNRAMAEERILYIRGKVAKVFREGEKVVVWGVDTLTGRRVEVRADLVVLAQAMVPSPGTEELARKLRVACGGEGFLKEAHPKLRPLEALTAGVFLAGAAQGPKDIPESVAQASGAAAKVVALLSQPKLAHAPEVAEVAEELCSGCGICAPQCPYGAIAVDEVARVNEVLCEGCGTCVAACPSGALTFRNVEDEQVLRMVRAALAEVEGVGV